MVTGMIREVRRKGGSWEERRNKEKEVVFKGPVSKMRRTSHNEIRIADESDGGKRRKPGGC
jgi:hypothetical protein